MALKFYLSPLEKFATWPPMEYFLMLAKLQNSSLLSRKAKKSTHLITGWSRCCNSYEVTRSSSSTIGVQLQMIHYIFRTKILSKDAPSFQRLDWLKNERHNEVEIRCSISKTRYGECEWDRLWSVKWMRWKWMTKWMSWTLVHEMNGWTLVNEMNDIKVTRKICNTRYCHWFQKSWKS